MSIHYTLNITAKRAPAETTPGREPGWYLKTGDRILADCDTEEEAKAVASDLLRLEVRVAHDARNAVQEAVNALVDNVRCWSVDEIAAFAGELQRLAVHL